MDVETELAELLRLRASGEEERAIAGARRCASHAAPEDVVRFRVAEAAAWLELGRYDEVLAASTATTSEGPCDGPHHLHLLAIRTSAHLSLGAELAAVTDLRHSCRILDSWPAEHPDRWWAAMYFAGSAVDIDLLPVAADLWDAVPEPPVDADPKMATRWWLNRSGIERQLAMAASDGERDVAGRAHWAASGRAALRCRALLQPDDGPALAGAVHVQHATALLESTGTLPDRPFIDEVAGSAEGSMLLWRCEAMLLLVLDAVARADDRDVARWAEPARQAAEDVDCRTLLRVLRALRDHARRRRDVAGVDALAAQLSGLRSQADWQERVRAALWETVTRSVALS